MEPKERIKRAILEAFAEVPYPGDDALVFDPTFHDGMDIQRDFKGRHWRDFPFEKADRYQVAALRPEAQKFYLPGFMLYALERFPEVFYPADLCGLLPPDDATRFRREHDTYTSAQKEAIRLFLLAHTSDESKHPDMVALARLALERYWGTKEENLLAAPPDAVAMRTRQEQVKQAIRQAFAEVPYPGDEAIAEHPEGLDGPELISDFKGYHWREVPRSIVRYNDISLSFFSVSGLRFYLPAYLLTAFECNDNIVYFTLLTLDPTSDDPHLGEWAEARLDVFGPAERSAIRLFLEYMRDDPYYSAQEEAQKALDAYWAKDA